MEQSKPKTAQSALLKVGIENPYQALLWLPKRHEDYTLITDGNGYSALEGEKVCIKLTIIGKPSQREKGRFTVAAADDAGQMHRLMQFGMLRFSPWATIEPGDTVWVRAKVVMINQYHYLNNVEWVPAEMVGSVRPVYSGKTGVVSAAVITAAASAAAAELQHIHDATLAIRESFGGMEEKDIIDLAKCNLDLASIIAGVHAPTSIQQADQAMRSARKIAVAYIRWSATQACQRSMAMKSIIRISGNQMRQLVASLPFKLTEGDGSQAAALREIIKSLASPYPMDALLSADVGAGKTVVYGLIAAAAQALGHRAAIIIPNTILVEQVVKELRAFFPGVPVCKVCEGSTEMPHWADNPLLVGTSKIFSLASRARWVPDLLVFDEQQKTSEGQRNKLRAPHTNVLETTATPLPKSVALLTHGEKQLIQVRTQHANKQITTSIIDQSHKAEMFSRIKTRVNEGAQVAIIYPRVDASSDADTKSVVAAGAMWEKHFPGQVAVLHGKMSEDEKVRVMHRIKEEGTPVIVASSIIEIGVTIENLRLIMVVHADRYGVFTLHQFRGRLARLGGEGECLLYLPEEVEEETLERIRLLETTTDGFELAEKDMHLRGFGDLAESDGAQSGKTPTLFRGIQLMPADLA